MPLPTGTRLGQYEILAPLGAGGMGEVYRASDSKLGREVALKVLPREFARDSERLLRFEREARVLASLNHPNIAAIYGFEPSDDVPFLVLELVAGETLTGPLPVDEALAAARQIAAALEAAHEKGIVHRDLKPANIKITPEGKVKVLDFGLAKAFADETVAGDPALSPTISLAATRAGVILGTAAYMSPEQARGKAVDQRADVWAFGCVLYEMLTGRRAFGGETLTDTLAGIVHHEPDWQALPPETPANIRLLLRRCLQRDLARRLRDIWAARLELEEAWSGPAGPLPGPPPAPRPARLPWLMALLGVAAALVLAVAHFGEKSPAAIPTTRLAVTLPPSEPLSASFTPSVAISPDGSRLAYVAKSGSTTKLYLRAMDQFESKPGAGTEGAHHPFFSPDGQWVAFFADGKLKKVPIAGGPAMILVEAPSAQGGTWGSDDKIYFTPHFTAGISRIAAAGGKPEVITRPEPKQGEGNHIWPEVLPGAAALLFTTGKGASSENAVIEVLSLETGQRRKLIEGGSNAHFVPTGHLIYSRGGVLMAAPFDLRKLAVTGPSRAILEGVIPDSRTGGAHFSVSSNGVLAYAPGETLTVERSLVWADRKGVARPAVDARRPYEDLDLSPDGKHAALTVEGPAWNIFILDLARGALTRLTFDEDNRDPVWTPDGKRVIYGSFRQGRHGLFWKAADGSGQEERLTSSENWQFASSVSPDSRVLAYSEASPASAWDLWALPLEGERKPWPLLQTKFNESQAMFSPDGRWLAYVSNESGRLEVYVQAYAAGTGQQAALSGGKWQISTDGGGDPIWAAGGTELFYRSGDSFMTVPIETKPAFRAGTPRMLFEGRYLQSGRDYDATPGADRFLLIQEAEQKAAPTQIRVVLNWFEDLRRSVPAGKK